MKLVKKPNEQNGQKKVSVDTDLCHRNRNVSINNSTQNTGYSKLGLLYL